MAERIMRAREIQRKRFADSPLCYNAELSGSLLEKYCYLTESCHALMQSAMSRLALSARAYTRILRVARTIADLADEETINESYLAEAIGLRVLDRPI